MNSAQVMESIRYSGLSNEFNKVNAAMRAVWDQNRKVLFSLVLDEDATEGIDAAQELPALIDAAISALVEFHTAAQGLQYDIGA